MKTLTQELLKQQLSYCEQAGQFLRLRTRSGLKREKPTGHIDGAGYCAVYVLGRSYLAHRLAWFYVYGAWPTRLLDHINGNPLDNRIANLRECDSSQNQMNRIAKVNKQAGVRFKGVTLHKQTGKYQAGISSGGKFRYLGLFDREEDAARAYDRVCIECFGAFAKPNFPQGVFP